MFFTFDANHGLFFFLFGEDVSVSATLFKAANFKHFHPEIAKIFRIAIRTTSMTLDSVCSSSVPVLRCNEARFCKVISNYVVS